MESNSNILESLFKNLKGWINKINDSAKVNLNESFGNTLYDLNKSYDNFNKLALKELSEEWKDSSEKPQSSNENNTRVIQFEANKNINSNVEVNKLTDLYYNSNKPKNNEVTELCNKFLETKKDRIEVKKSRATPEDSKTDNQLAGQDTYLTCDARAYTNLQNSPKTTIQNGEYSRAVESTRTDHAKARKIKYAKMESESERRRRYEQEDELVYDYLTDLTVEAIQRERNDRLRMLKRLCEKQSKETRPTRREVEELLRMEKQKTSEINQAIFVKLNNEKMSRTIYDEIMLPDENGESEYEVTSIISIKRLKKELTTTKPINLNLTINEDDVTRTIMYVAKNDIVIPGDISRIQTINPNQTEIGDKENKNSNTSKNKEKPKIISNVQLKHKHVRG